MAYKIATTVKQAPWECRWARAGRRLCPDPEHGHPENLWICVRPTARGQRQVVSEGECDACAHWEACEDDGDAGD
jgi:hypothetical protein